MQITSIDKMDRGLAYAECCFETFRVIDGQIFDWPGHWQRLVAGMAEFAVQLSASDGVDAHAACLRQAVLQADDCLLRLTLSGGDADWGLFNRSSQPLLSIQCMPYQANHSAVVLRLQNWPLPLQKKIAKCAVDYAETLRVLRRSADGHVLFEQGGELLATATANVLMYRQGRWCTPRAEAGVLPGRVRACLLRKGTVVETSCLVAWLDDCEAMLVSNSAVFLQPVAQITGIQRSEPMCVEHAAMESLFDTLRGEEGVRL